MKFKIIMIKKIQMIRLWIKKLKINKLNNKKVKRINKKISKKFKRLKKIK